MKFTRKLLEDMVGIDKAAEIMVDAAFPKPKNKNGAISSRCGQGHAHPSKGEAAYCDRLHLRQRIGEIKDLEVYATIPLWEGRRYKADFRYKEKTTTVFIRTITASGRPRPPRITWVVIVDDFKGAQSRDFQQVKKAWPHYGRGLLRETHRSSGSGFHTVREIPGRWKK